MILICMYVCMYVFIKLHITTQSGPVILVILCHSHWSSRGGINDTYYENLWSDATKGTYVCIFIKLHITAQSGLVILVILCHSRWSSQGGINDTCYVCMYVCMYVRTYVCMYVFIKLHITTQSGPVILVILCHSHWSSRGGINDTYYECMYVCMYVCMY